MRWTAAVSLGAIVTTACLWVDFGEVDGGSLESPPSSPGLVEAAEANLVRVEPVTRSAAAHDPAEPTGGSFTPGPFAARPPPPPVLMHGSMAQLPPDQAAMMSPLGAVLPDLSD
jgi:hypothetical protein